MSKPSLGEIFRVWLSLGAQSFGGGNATLALIRRAMIDQRGWLADAEFVRDWALCQVAPGINLLGLTVLIGRRLGGGTGIALSVAGLLLPSVSITILLTACYAHFQGLAAVQAAVRGVIPATVGLGLITAYQMGRPMLAVSRREGRLTFSVGLTLLLGSAVAAALWQSPVVFVLSAAGGIGALAFWLRDVRRRRKTS